MRGLAKLTARTHRFFSSLLRESLPGKPRKLGIAEEVRSKRGTECVPGIPVPRWFRVDKVVAGRFKANGRLKRPGFYHPDEEIPDLTPA